MDELDLPVAPERVDYRVQRVPDDAVAAFDPRLRQQLPHHVRDFSCRPTLPPAKAGQNRAPSLSGLAGTSISGPASAVSIDPPAHL